MTTMSDVGWVWEGQPAYRDFPPSIYGLGEGCEYFGLSQAYYLYHGNNETALTKLAGVRQVLCDISFWRPRKLQTAEGEIGWGVGHDKSLATVLEQAGAVSRLSRQFPNVAGALFDDFIGAVDGGGYSFADCASIRDTLKADNPDLKLYTTTYTHEVSAGRWEPYVSLVDGVFLWVWESADLCQLDEYVRQCRDLVGDKPLILGCYLRDYPAEMPVPMDRLQYQWERIPGYLEQGLVDGYCILGAYLIDHQPEQAEWVRDFIAAN
jgi:hypothetical protein